MHNKIHQVTSLLLCFPKLCSAGLQICGAWSVKQCFCLLEMLNNFPVSVLALILFFFCIRAFNFSSHYLSLPGLAFTSKPQTTDSFFYLPDTKFGFFQVFLFSSIIYTPGNFLCGLATCWCSFIELYVPLWWWIRSFCWWFFFLKATRVATERIGTFVYSWSCRCDLTTITWAPGRSGALCMFGWVGDFSLCVSCCLALPNLHIHLWVAEVTSVWLSKHDSLVTWSSSVWIYSQPACSCAFLRDIWTVLSLFSVSILKVKESPWFQHLMLLVDT